MRTAASSSKHPLSPRRQLRGHSGTLAQACALSPGSGPALRVGLRSTSGGADDALKRSANYPADPQNEEHVCGAESDAVRSAKEERVGNPSAVCHGGYEVADEAPGAGRSSSADEGRRSEREHDAADQKDERSENPRRRALVKQVWRWRPKILGREVDGGER
jgi:hypothetical protein